MSTPSVSIIIPAYNVAGYIEPCLESILCQKYSDFEVIVIDDGSTDATGEIADAYARSDSRVKVLHQPNGGVSNARNTGIKAATGEYFLFFDGDDFVEPNTIDELVGAIREKGADIVIYGYYRYRDGSVTQTCLPIFEEGLYEGTEIIHKLLPRFVGISCEGVNRWMAGEKEGLYVENPALWRCISRAETIRENGLAFDTTLKVGEDTIFISDLLSCAKRCLVLHKCYYYLVFRETSAIATYEKDPAAKLKGKHLLLTARLALTERIGKRSGECVRLYWEGTVVMSILEMAFLLAKRSSGGMPFVEGYRAYLGYARQDAAKDAVRAFKPIAKPSAKLIPLLMLKLKCHLPLFICAALLNIVKYEFVRE